MINSVQRTFFAETKHTRNKRELPRKTMSAYALNTVEGLKLPWQEIHLRECANQFRKHHKP
jgi:hypothetical protein